MTKRKNDPGSDGSAHDPAPATAAPVNDVETSPERTQPARAVRLRNVRAAIWANDGENGTTRYNVTVSRSYRDQEGNWHTTESFGRDDLLLLAKVADIAHTWIWEQMQGGAADSPC
jgi:hypothetical protein